MESTANQIEAGQKVAALVPRSEFGEMVWKRIEGVVSYIQKTRYSALIVLRDGTSFYADYLTN